MTAVSGRAQVAPDQMRRAPANASTHNVVFDVDIIDNSVILSATELTSVRVNLTQARLIGTRYCCKVSAWEDVEMKGRLTICYAIEVDLDDGDFPPEMDTPERRLLHYMVDAERNPARYTGNKTPIVNGQLIGVLPTYG